MKLTFAIGCFVVPVATLETFQQRFASENVARVTMIGDCRVYVVIVADDIRGRRNVWCVASDHCSD